MAHRISAEERHRALPSAIGRVATDLAECIAETTSLGMEPPADVVNMLGQLGQWAGAVRDGQPRPLRLVGRLDLDEWLREVREDDAQARVARLNRDPSPQELRAEVAAVATPIPHGGPYPWVPSPRWWESFRPSVAHWRASVWWRYWSAHLRGQV